MKVAFIEGGLPRIGGMAWDITDRVRAEPTLRMRVRTLAVATQGLPIADMQQPEYPGVYVSPEFERISGYAVQEVLGPDADETLRRLGEQWARREEVDEEYAEV